MDMILDNFMSGFHGFPGKRQGFRLGHDRLTLDSDATSDFYHELRREDGISVFEKMKFGCRFLVGSSDFSRAERCRSSASLQPEAEEPLAS